MDELDHSSSQHREITLGTATLLGIFFGLVLVCAVFFGFGYSLGRRSIQSATDASPANDSTSFNASKPSPGGDTGQASRRSGSDTHADPYAARSAANEPADPTTDRRSATESSASHPAPTLAEPGEATPPRSSSSSSARSASAPSTTIPAASASAQLSSLMVQIAAVSHQEDADVLVRALKKQGHDVTARQDPTDRLIHVQLGPFNNRKDAEAMRQTLLTEGYNAIVK